MGPPPAASRGLPNMAGSADAAFPAPQSTGPGAQERVFAGLSGGLGSQMSGGGLGSQMSMLAGPIVPRDSDKVVVSVCGRSLPVDAASASSLSALQNALQQALHMEGQIFQLFDAHGTVLPTDQALAEALAFDRTPLCATLSDASIHYIENRREELAQMQWKLVRDQMTGACARVAELSRVVQELKEQLDTDKQENRSARDRVRSEILSVNEGLREKTNGDILQVVDRMDAVGQMLQKERSVREVQGQGFEIQIQGVRNAVESDRSVRREEIASITSLIEEAKESLNLETRERELLEDRHHVDMSNVTERMDDLVRRLNDNQLDTDTALKEKMTTMNNTLQDRERHFVRMCAETESAQVQISSTLTQTLDRLNVVDTRTADSVMRGNVAQERYCERIEKLAHAIEQVRLGQRAQGKAIESLVSGVHELEGQVIPRLDSIDNEMMERERPIRAQLNQLRGITQTLCSEQNQGLSDLEEKVSMRLERESAARETATKKVLEEVGVSIERGMNGPGSVKAPLGLSSAKPGIVVRTGVVVPTTSIPVRSPTRQTAEPTTSMPSAMIPQAIRTTTMRSTSRPAARNQSPVRALSPTPTLLVPPAAPNPGSVLVQAPLNVMRSPSAPSFAFTSPNSPGRGSIIAAPMISGTLRSISRPA